MKRRNAFENRWRPWFLAAVVSPCFFLAQVVAQIDPNTNPLGLLPVDAGFLRVLSQNASGKDVLELVRIAEDSSTWDFSGGTPAPTVFQVYTNDVAIPGIAVAAVGFKRRGYYGPLPLENDEHRIECALYLELAAPISEGSLVRVTASNGLIPAGMKFETSKSPLRYSPAIHVNEQGYMPGQQKLAMIGYYFGSLNVAPGTHGEMDISALLDPEKFHLVDAISGVPVTFTPAVRQRSDSGDDASSASEQYKNVVEVDFSQFNQPGEYRLRVDGLGASFPFRIGDGVAMAVARAFALGLYHRRCGEGTAGHQVNDLPFTRFVHGDCHFAMASIPIPETLFSTAWEILAAYGGDPPFFVDQHAPLLDQPANQLFPFGVNQPEVRFTNGEYRLDVSGGHHDAGDYSKYTINSAMLIHTLIFAADNFEGTVSRVGALDNLGIPESGNGAGDLLDEAKREADFLLKMQDNGTEDVNGDPVVPGGFYSLVYPRDGEYEHNVLPDHGDSQIVWPKTTSATAAAVAALAEIGSSPGFAAAYQNSFDPPLNRTNWIQNPYLAAAKRGWDFLMSAVDADYAWAAPGTSGKDNSFQRLYNYGDSFGHNDELAWAAAAMFAAGYNTGNGYSDTNQQHDPLTLLMEWYPEPDSANPVPYSYPCGFSDEMGPCWTRIFGWWEMAEGYGCAVRDYAFAQRSGRLAVDANIDTVYLQKCENAIAHWADKVRQWSDDNAYGVSLAPDFKNNWNPGYFFPSCWSYDIAVADSLWRASDPQFDAERHAHNISAIVENSNFECGRNPNNVSFVTGIGWKRQRAIVDQYSWNDHRTLPPTGILIGALQFRFGNANPYNFDDLYYPPTAHGDFGDDLNSFSLYDRWADAYSPDTESVTHQMARGLCVAAYLASQTHTSTQTWSAADIETASGTIELTNAPPRPGSIAFVTLNSTLDLSNAQVVWESFGAEPRFGQSATVQRGTVGELWIEAEACLPDGRRVFGTRTLYVNDPLQAGQPYLEEPDTIALYHFDGNLVDATGHGYNLTAPGGSPAFSDNTSWMANPGGKVVRFSGLGKPLTATIPRNALVDLTGETPQPESVSIELRLYPRRYSYIDSGFAELFELYQEDDAEWSIQYQHDGTEIYDNPVITGSGAILLNRAGWHQYLSKDTWHEIRITVEPTPRPYHAAMSVYIDGIRRGGPDLVIYNPRLIPYEQEQEDWHLTIGQFDGDMDEVRISRTILGNQPPMADFEADVPSGPAPLTVTFSNLSVNATSFLWNFGDGHTSTSFSPIHTYSTIGGYTVSLTAMGGGETNALAFTNLVRVLNHGLLLPTPTYSQGNIIFAFETAKGLTYEVRFKNSLDEETWQLLQTLAGDGTQKYVTNSAPSQRQRYYRIRME